MAAGNGSAIDWSSDISSQFLKYDSGIDGMILSSWNNTTFYTQQTERVRINSVGNVGIGTTNPLKKLQINAVTASIRLEETGAGSKRLELSIDDSAVAKISANQSGQQIAFETVGTERIRIDAGGNVGIGTTSPSSKLHIDDATTPYITISRAGVPTWQLRNNFPSNQYGFSFNNTTAGTVPLFIGTGGNIGIGLDNPTVKLDIASTQGNGIVMRYDTSTAYQSWIRPYWNSGTDTRIDFAINRTANVTPDVIMSVGYGGNVGIGTTSPSTKLDVSGSAIRSFITAGSGAEPGFIVDYPSSNGYGAFFVHVNNTRRWRIGSVGDTNVQPALNFWQEGTGSRMIINNVGNVGIGFTAPAANLHVFGPTMIVGDSNTTQNVRQTIVGSTTGNASTTAKKIFVCGHTSTGTINVTAFITAVSTASATATFSFANAYGNSVTPNRLSYISLNSTITSIDCNYNNSGYQMEISVTYTGATAPTLYFTAEGMGSGIWTL